MKGISSSGITGFLAKLFPWLQREPPDLTQIKAEIVLPTEGSLVPYRIAVEGTHSGVPDNMELWLVLYWEEIAIYYPQSAPIMRLPGGAWHSVVSVGPSEAESKGRTYDILLVAATRGASRQFTKYEQEASARGKWSGMLGLPRGSVILDTVTVTRQGTRPVVQEEEELGENKL